MSEPCFYEAFPLSLRSLRCSQFAIYFAARTDSGTSDCLQAIAPARFCEDWSFLVTADRQTDRQTCNYQNRDSVLQTENLRTSDRSFLVRIIPQCPPPYCSTVYYQQIKLFLPSDNVSSSKNISYWYKQEPGNMFVFFCCF